MSDRPDKCKWCGHADVVGDHWDARRFACGSSQDFVADIWWQSSACVEIVELRKRVAEAIDKAQRSTRFGLRIVCVYASDMDCVIAILEGNSPENLEGAT